MGSYASSTGGCAACPVSKPYAPAGSMSSSACVSLCPDSTWTLWLDTRGVEGLHSCFKRYSTYVAWATANSNCQALGANIHLLTSRQVRQRTRAACCASIPLTANGLAARKSLVAYLNLNVNSLLGTGNNRAR